MSKSSYTLPLFDAPPVIETPTKLRPYQDRALRLARMHLDAGVKRLLLVAPTRSGKTVLIAAIARGATIPVLFVAHRLELIDQCAQELNLAGISNLGVIRADDHRTNPSAAVQVASLATLAKRDKPWAGQEIIIIVDECHRAASDSYRALFDHYPQAIVIGFTATPWRLDGKPLGGDGLFTQMEVVCTYQELLKNPEWLLAPDIYAPPVDVSQISMRGGDYDEDEAAVVMDRLTGNIVDHWLKRAHMHPVFNAKGQREHMKFVEGPRRRTFAFACNIDHSLSICARFEKVGVKIIHIDGTTPEAHRRAALKDLAAHRVEIVSNVNILLEGVNVPEAKCVIHARPTQSLTLWRQSSCRVLTSWKDPVFGAIRPLILDHADNTSRLDPPHMDWNWSLNGKPQRRAGLAPLKVCKSCYAYVESSRTICPHCGAEFSKNDRQPERTESDEELQMRNTDPGAVKRAYFDTQVAIARGKGFKPGFASAMYKQHYGDWPPRPWGNEIKAEFAKDAMWQDRLQRREKNKADRAAAAKLEEAFINGETQQAVDLLSDKLRRVEALEQGTTAEGERKAAHHAADMLRKRIAALLKSAAESPTGTPSPEYNLTEEELRGAWSVSPGVVQAEMLPADLIAAVWREKMKPRQIAAPCSQCGGSGIVASEPCPTCSTEAERDVFADDELPESDGAQIDPWDAPLAAAGATGDDKDLWYIPPEEEGIPF